MNWNNIYLKYLKYLHRNNFLQENMTKIIGNSLSGIHKNIYKLLSTTIDVKKVGFIAKKQMIITIILLHANTTLSNLDFCS